jgi:hypothetical protein
MQNAAPQILTDVGDLSWVVGLIHWLVDRSIIPGWVAQLLLFTLHMFVPAVRGRPEAQKDMNDLHQVWDQYTASHPNAAAFGIGGAQHITRG